MNFEILIMIGSCIFVSLVILIMGAIENMVINDKPTGFMRVILIATLAVVSYIYTMYLVSHIFAEQVKLLLLK